MAILANTCRTPQTGAKFRLVCNHPSTALGSVDGSVNQVTARLVAPEAYILIKAIAMDERTKDKDAYDIAFVLKHYKPSLADLAKKVRGVSQAGIGKEALELLRAKFRTFDSVGPVWAGRAASTAGEDAVQFQRAAYEDAAELFRRLDAI